MSFKRLTEINFSNVAQFGDVGFGFLSVCCYILYYLIILEFPFPFFFPLLFLGLMHLLKDYSIHHN